jgi:2-(1,2-epoxy-1,2-dihydrophenyl)acetyl-CoA isomerase
MSYETIVVDRIGSIARIALNRPEKRNAVNDTVHEELRFSGRRTAGRSAISAPGWRRATTR